MKKNLTKVASIALLSALTFASVSVTQPKPAHAIVGAIAGSFPVVVVGGVLTGVGLLGVSTSLLIVGNVKFDDSSSAEDNLVEFVTFPSAFLSVVGLIVLDGGNAEFGHLTQAQANKAGLSQTEWLSYEEELAEINAILQDQLADRNVEFERTGKVSIANSMAGWDESSQALSAEAFSAVKKIAAHGMKKTAQARR